MPFPSAARLDLLLSAFAEQRILVVGDVMLDRYLWGDTSRISPEAPVPVIEAREETQRLGGAANVAHNVRALGASPFLMGVVGDDLYGREFCDLLRRHGVASDSIEVDRARRTTSKTRVIARNQQVVRIDREDTAEIEGEVLERVLRRALDAMSSCAVCVISDYGKGVVTRGLLEPLLAEAHARGVAVCVDPKETHFLSYRGVDTITPNLLEAGQAFGRRLHDLPTLRAAGAHLRRELGARSVLITRGEQGMTLFTEDENPSHFPAMAREVFDVTGAGDTVVGVFAVARAADATLAEAAALANHAAGLVVREVGTAVGSVEALRQAVLARPDLGAPLELSAHPTAESAPPDRR